MKLSNGLVVCDACGTYAHDIPPSAACVIDQLPVTLRELLASLTSGETQDVPTFAIRSIDSASNRIRSHAELESAAAQAIDLTFARIVATLSGAQYSFHSLVLEYTAMPSWETKPTLQLDFATLTALRPPHRIIRAAQMLVKHGFVLSAVHLTGTGVVFRSTREPASSRCDATLTWLAR